MCAHGPAASAADRVFTMLNYPVDATARNAVEAKESAIAEGRRRAFRSLLKRLVPVTEYARLDALRETDPRQLVSGIAVRSEERSSTRYIASLDFSFAPEAVRDVLNQHGVPFLEDQAAETKIVAIYRAPGGTGAAAPAGMDQAEGAKLWATVWRDLDHSNALTPLTIAGRVARLHDDAISALTRGDMTALRIFAQEYQSERIVLALAAPDPATKQVRIVLSGHDAVGQFHLDHTYRIFGGDVAYALELAAVVSQGILEGRWKATRLPGAGGGPSSAGAAAAVQIWVGYSSLAQWQSIQEILAGTPGVAGLRVGGQTARSATVSLTFPGGGEALSAALAPRGLTLEQQGPTWVLR